MLNHLQWRFAVISILCFSLLFAHLSPIQAQNPTVTISPAEIVLQGTPGQTIAFPVQVSAGKAEATRITLSLAGLSRADRPDPAILGSQISFTPAGFDLPAEAPARQVWGSIGPLPAVPGEYTGVLVATWGLTGTRQITAPVRLTVQFAQVQAGPLGGNNALQMAGHAGDLSAPVQLSAVDAPASNLTISAEPLRQNNGNAVIDPAQVTLSPNPLSLTAKETVLATISVQGDVEPGKYQGNIYFHAANQSYNQGTSLEVQVEVIPTPALNFPQGNSLSAQLAQCGWGLDCALTRLLPADFQQPGLMVQLTNPTEDVVLIQSLQPALTRRGTVNATGAGNLLTLPDLPLAVPAQSTLDVVLPVAKAQRLPGHYQGSLTFHLQDAQGRPATDPAPTVQVDLNIRRGPLGALALILGGIVLGRLAYYISGETVRHLRDFYRLRARMLLYEPGLSPEERTRLQTDAESLRLQIYQGGYEQLARKLAVFADRPSRLLWLGQNANRVEAACDDLEPADAGLLHNGLADLRRRVMDDKAFDLTVAFNTLPALAEPLKHLRALASKLEAADLTAEARQHFRQSLEQARDCLKQGNLEQAEDAYQKLNLALEVWWPQVGALRTKAGQLLAGEPVKGQLIDLNLKLAGEAVQAMDFETAKLWLAQVENHLRDWKPKQSGGGDLMGSSPGGKADTTVWKILTDSIEELTTGLSRWQPLAFLGKQPDLHATGTPEVAPPSNWQVRWANFRNYLGPELGLHLGTPLVWLLTVILTALIGFYSLYVQQGTTFGADPLWDSLPLFLWGLTSDVTGATLDKLAALRTKNI